MLTSTRSSLIDTAYDKSRRNSFWIPGNFKRTTDRMKNGYRLCSILHILIEERAKIEAAYSQNLHFWAKFCGRVFDEAAEYGTMRKALKGILDEAQCLSEIHSKVKDRLHCGDFQSLEIWKECAERTVFYEVKEHKQIQNDFKRIQKPFKKQLEQVETAKQKYHRSCDKNKILKNKICTETRVCRHEKKEHEKRIEKSDAKMIARREKYKSELEKLRSEYPDYVKAMTELFMKCQEIEEARLVLVRTVLFAVHKALSTIQDPSLSNIYEELYHTVDSAECEEDLRWWSKTYGADMPFEFPEFVESPALLSISLLEEQLKVKEQNVHRTSTESCYNDEVPRLPAPTKQSVSSGASEHTT